MKYLQNLNHLMKEARTQFPLLCKSLDGFLCTNVTCTVNVYGHGLACVCTWMHVNILYMCMHANMLYCAHACEHTVRANTLYMHMYVNKDEHVLTFIMSVSVQGGVEERNSHMRVW